MVRSSYAERPTGRLRRARERLEAGRRCSCRKWCAGAAPVRLAERLGDREAVRSDARADSVAPRDPVPVMLPDGERKRLGDVSGRAAEAGGLRPRFNEASKRSPRVPIFKT
jgi:hypothetical protein